MTHLRKIMLEELERRNYTASTIRHYLSFVERFAKHFGKSPDKLGPDHLRSYQAYLLKELKLCPGSVVNHVSALRFLFVRTLGRHEFRQFIPFPRVRKKLPNILSREEVARLIEASGSLFGRTLLMVLYGTGMRRAEVARLKIADIDSQRMVIHVVNGKGGKDRDLPLSPALLETLRAHWRWLKPRVYLFPSRMHRHHEQPITGFAKSLAEEGYAHATAIRYLRAAAHLGAFVQRRHGVLAEIDVNTLQAFRRHLLFGRCPRGSGGKTGYHAHFGVKLFHRYLIQRGICPSPPPATDAEDAVSSLVSTFADSYQRHCGVTQPTVRLYSRGATELLAALGKDVRTWSPHSLRAFLLDQAKQSGAETTQKLITSLRAFLRCLSFCGEARPDLDRAIPAIAHWRLASLPRCLSADELIYFVQGTTKSSIVMAEFRP